MLKAKSLALLALLSTLSFSTWALEDNAALKSMYQEDQRQRSEKFVDWQQTLGQDRMRALAVRQFLKDGGIRTAEDYSNAARILNHGSGLADFRLAVALAELGQVVDPKNKELMQIYAMAWDRMMLAQSRPQWYATQYSRTGGDRPYALEPVDKMVSDAQRSSMGLSTLAEMRRKIEHLNQIEPVEWSKPAHSESTATPRVYLAKDKYTILKLIDKQPALGLFWNNLAEHGLPQPMRLNASTKNQAIVISKNKADAQAIANGERAIVDPMSSEDACVFRYEAKANAKRQLELDVSYDCLVKPGPKLIVNPTHRYLLIASELDSRLSGRNLKLVSVEELKLPEPIDATK